MYSPNDYVININHKVPRWVMLLIEDVSFTYTYSYKKDKKLHNIKINLDEREEHLPATDQAVAIVLLSVVLLPWADY